MTTMIAIEDYIHHFGIVSIDKELLYSQFVTAMNEFASNPGLDAAMKICDLARLINLNEKCPIEDLDYPIFYATSLGSSDLFVLLISLGADFTKTIRQDPDTFVDVIQIALKHNHYDLAEQIYLGEMNVKVWKQDEDRLDTSDTIIVKIDSEPLKIDHCKSSPCKKLWSLVKRDSFVLKIIDSQVSRGIMNLGVLNELLILSVIKSFPTETIDALVFSGADINWAWPHVLLYGFRIDAVDPYFKETDKLGYMKPDMIKLFINEKYRVTSESLRHFFLRRFPHEEIIELFQLIVKYGFTDLPRIFIEGTIQYYIKNGNGCSTESLHQNSGPVIESFLKYAHAHKSENFRAREYFFILEENAREGKNTVNSHVAEISPDHIRLLKDESLLEVHNILIWSWRVHVAKEIFEWKIPNGLAFFHIDMLPYIMWHGKKLNLSDLDKLVNVYQKICYDEGMMTINFVNIITNRPCVPKLMPSLYRFLSSDANKIIWTITMIRSCGKSTSVPSINIIPNELLFEVFANF